MSNERLEHLERFYSILERHEKNIGGARTLADCSGGMAWPKRGAYFFRESGENRTDTGQGPRVVRVGTHALKTGSATKLWTRLSQHKGESGSGGGNHRGSIFRLIVGTALTDRDGQDFPMWGDGATANGDVRSGERALECEVSKVIGNMPFLWLALEDDASPESRHGQIAAMANSALVSYRAVIPYKSLQAGMLGARGADRYRVRKSS